MRQPNFIPGRRTGFTLVEMLIVIGIIAALVAVVAVVATRARGTANKFQLAAQLQAIDVALEAYKTEFQSYPVTSFDDASVTYDNEANREGFRGARLLCKALMGSSGGQSGAIGAVGSNYALNRGDQDGKVGLGFAVPGRSGVATVADAAGNMVGKTYGPFLAANLLKISNISAITQTVDGNNYVRGDLMSNASDDQAILLDANGSPILYYPCLNPQAPIVSAPGVTTPIQYAYASRGRVDKTDSGTMEPAASNGFTGTPMYRTDDNGAFIDAPTFRNLLGDKSASGTPQYGAIDGTEKPAIRGKYILWTAGPDGKFGINAASKEPTKTDDVTNFDLD